MGYGILDMGQKHLSDSNALMSSAAKTEFRNNQIEEQAENAEKQKDNQTMGTMAGMGLRYGLSDAGKASIGKLLGGGSEAAVGTESAVNAGITQGAMTTGMQTGITAGTSAAVSSGVTTGAMTTGMSTGIAAGGATAATGATAAAAGGAAAGGAASGAAAGSVAGPIGALAGLAVGALFSRLF